MHIPSWQGIEAAGHAVSALSQAAGSEEWAFLLCLLPLLKCIPEAEVKVPAIVGIYAQLKINKVSPHCYSQRLIPSNKSAKVLCIMSF